MTSPNLSAADLAAIIDQIGNGFAPLDSFRVTLAGGASLPDGGREYFCQLPSAPPQPWRVARVTAYRNAWGAWRIGDVDIFAAVARSVTADDQEATDEIRHAVAIDPRTPATVTA